MPVDILRNIFILLKRDLSSIANVSKSWKGIVYDQNFRNKIDLPTEHFFNNAIWKMLPGVDAEKEPHLPLCIYRGDVGPKDYIGLVHKSIKVDGKEIKLTPKMLGELVAKKIKCPNSTGFKSNCIIDAIYIGRAESGSGYDEDDEHQGSETLHWVWLKGDVVGRNAGFDEQDYFAKLAGGAVSTYMDTLTCLFLDRVKFENSEFYKDTTIRLADKKQDLKPKHSLSSRIWNNLAVNKIWDELNRRAISWNKIIDLTSEDYFYISYHREEVTLPEMGAIVARRSIGI